MTAADPTPAIEALLSEVGSALADLVQVAQDSQVNGAEISATLVDLLALLSDRPAGGAADPGRLDRLVEAIRSLKPAPQPAPQVTVNNAIAVQPTPIENIVQVAAPVVQVVERAAPSDYEMHIAYDGQGRITSGRMTAVPRKAAK